MIVVGPNPIHFQLHHVVNPANEMPLQGEHTRDPAALQLIILLFWITNSVQNVQNSSYSIGLRTWVGVPWRRTSNFLTSLMAFKTFSDRVGFPMLLTGSQVINCLGMNWDMDRLCKSKFDPRQ
jgi:hypothetical protein